MIATTTADTPTKNHGALWPMLNAPPELVVNRNVRTPGTTSIGEPGRVASAQIFVIRSRPKETTATTKSVRAARLRRASTGQRRDCAACASLMQSSAYGRALIRAFSIGLPQRSHRP